MAFEKGKSGNPGGKHKEKLFRNALMMELKSAGEDMPDLREIARGLIERAKAADVATKEFIDRIDGKVPQAIVGDDEEAPFKVEVSWKSDASSLPITQDHNSEPSTTEANVGQFSALTEEPGKP